MFYNSVGTTFDDRFAALGGEKIMNAGLGDDQDPDKWETAWEEWSPELWNELGTAPPPLELPTAVHVTSVSSAADAASQPDDRQIMPGDAGGMGVLCPLVGSTPLTPGGRDVRHYEWGIEGTGITYVIASVLLLLKACY